MANKKILTTLAVLAVFAFPPALVMISARMNDHTSRMFFEQFQVWGRWMKSNTYLALSEPTEEHNDLSSMLQRKVQVDIQLQTEHVEAATIPAASNTTTAAPNTTTTTVDNCPDSPYGCKMYVSMGDCTNSWKSWMQKHCACDCGFTTTTPPTTTTLPTTTTAAPNTTTTVDNCPDSPSYCKNYVSWGYCTQSWMKQYCACDCGFEDEVTTTTKVANLTNVWSDASCHYYMSIDSGFCVYAYDKINCLKACATQAANTTEATMVPTTTSWDNTAENDTAKTLYARVTGYEDGWFKLETRGRRLLEQLFSYFTAPVAGEPFSIHV